METITTLKIRLWIGYACCGFGGFVMGWIHPVLGLPIVATGLMLVLL